MIICVLSNPWSIPIFCFYSCNLWFNPFLSSLSMLLVPAPAHRLPGDQLHHPRLPWAAHRHHHGLRGHERLQAAAEPALHHQSEALPHEGRQHYPGPLIAWLQNSGEYLALPITVNLVLMVANVLAAWGALTSLPLLLLPWLLLYLVYALFAASLLAYMLVLLQVGRGSRPLDVWFCVLLALVVVSMLLVSSHRDVWVRVRTLESVVARQRCYEARLILWGTNIP